MSNNKFFNIEKLATLGRANTTLFLCPIGAKQYKLGGNIGSTDFNYVEIKVLGCNQEVCLPDKEIMKTSINFVGLKASPNLIQGDEEVITYSQDFTYFKYLDPGRSQSSNFFYMKSFIKLSDNILDIFETDEVQVDLFESSRIIDYFQTTPTDVAVANREYIQIFLRADNIKHAYKRIGYDLLTFLGDVGGLFDIVMLMG